MDEWRLDEPAPARQEVTRSGRTGLDDPERETTAGLERIAGDPRYRELVRRRARFTWVLTAIMLVAYFGYVALIAFDKAVLARPIGGGVTTVGIPIGIGIILLGILLTAIYVRRANREFDPLVRALQQEHRG